MVEAATTTQTAPVHLRHRPKTTRPLLVSPLTETSPEVARA
jgi:hypothetical protein